MLAAMSSLASLAHGARAAAPAFNGLFYATAATIIPVLFLAIAVQGPLYGDLLKASAAALRRFREHKAGSSPRRLVLRLWIGSVLASSAAVAILIVTVGGEIGEIEALLSLNAQRAYGDPHAAIAAAVLLTAAAAVGPALAFARLMITLYPRIPVRAWAGVPACAWTLARPPMSSGHQRPGTCQLLAGQHGLELLVPDIA
jgi:hypothetical protein